MQGAILDCDSIGSSSLNNIEYNFLSGHFLSYAVQGNFPTSPLVTANAPCHPLVGGVAQWLERRSLTGELSLIYT